MEIMARIQEVESLQQKRKEVEQTERALRSALLQDYGLIKGIYALVVEFVNGRAGLNPDSVNTRKKFCFAVLYLYAPQSLCGAKMPKGLRREMSRELRMRAPNCVSAYCTNLLFDYRHYRGFRKDMDDLVEFIKERLRIGR